LVKRNKFSIGYIPLFDKKGKTYEYIMLLQNGSEEEYAANDIFLFDMINESENFIDYALKIGNINFYPAVIQKLEKDGYFSNETVAKYIRGLVGIECCKIPNNRKIFRDLIRNKFFSTQPDFL
jgi:hypothetical protein